MLKIGLCGGMGAGKTEVSRILAKMGVPSINTDELSRIACEKGSECVNELVGFFGSFILASDGSLDRKALAKIAFSKAEYTDKLNKITHPHITDVMNRKLEEFEKQGVSAVFIDAPLLFESGLDKVFDFNVAVIAYEESRIARALKRDGITREAAIERMKKQKSNDFLVENCDYYIENNGSSEELKQKVKDLALKLGIIKY